MLRVSKVGLINAKAAYEVAEVIARTCEHLEYGQSSWNFKQLAKFPSVHSYVDFISSVAMMGSRVRDEIDLDDVNRIAIVLELCFYRTNSGIAGIADSQFYAPDQSGAYKEYTLLNLRRNSDDHVAARLKNVASDRAV